MIQNGVQVVMNDNPDFLSNNTSLSTRDCRLVAGKEGRIVNCETPQEYNDSTAYRVRLRDSNGQIRDFATYGRGFTIIDALHKVKDESQVF